MKHLFLSILTGCCLISNAQLSPSDAISGPEPAAVSDGKLIAWYPNGNKQFEGFLLRENLHGIWTSWYSNGQILDSGSLKKGVPSGQWFGWNEKGNPQFLRTYSADKWQQFQNEKSRYHPKRVSMPLTEMYHNNRKQAQKYTNAVNTFCAVANCKRNDESLQQTIESNSSQHYHPIFENGLLHGPFANYFPDGSVKDSGNYKNGLPEGMWIKWTDDKQFYWLGHYQHGRKNKEWKLYTSSDKLIRIVFYRQGRYLWRNDMKEGFETTAEEMSGF